MSIYVKKIHLQNIFCLDTEGLTHNKIYNSISFQLQKNTIEVTVFFQFSTKLKSQIGTKSKGKLSLRLYSIQFESKWKSMFLSAWCDTEHNDFEKLLNIECEKNLSILNVKKNLINIECKKTYQYWTWKKSLSILNAKKKLINIEWKKKRINIEPYQNAEGIRIKYLFTPWWIRSFISFLLSGSLCFPSFLFLIICWMKIISCLKAFMI